MKPDWATLTNDLYAASRGRCHGCGQPLPNERVARHHRRLRSQGGTHTLPNLMLLHTDCHTFAHGHPQWAVSHGWIVRSGIVGPEDIPVIVCRDPGRCWSQDLQHP